jgi:hypothetical protein
LAEGAGQRADFGELADHAESARMLLSADCLLPLAFLEAIMFTRNRPCEECKGTGKILLLVTTKPCIPCGGTGIVTLGPSPLTSPAEFASRFGGFVSGALGAPFDVGVDRDRK